MKLLLWGYYCTCSYGASLHDVHVFTNKLDMACLVKFALSHFRNFYASHLPTCMEKEMTQRVNGLLFIRELKALYDGEVFEWGKLRESCVMSDVWR